VETENLNNFEFFRAGIVSAGDPTSVWQAPRNVRPVFYHTFGADRASLGAGHFPSRKALDKVSAAN
jgi:hypothetical protein